MKPWTPHRCSPSGTMSRVINAFSSSRTTRNANCSSGSNGVTRHLLGGDPPHTVMGVHRGSKGTTRDQHGGVRTRCASRSRLFVVFVVGLDGFFGDARRVEELRDFV